MLNPYYLHPNENLALYLKSIFLTSNNYHSWSCLMKLALISKNKESVIDGSIPIPNKDDLMYKHERGVILLSYLGS